MQIPSNFTPQLKKPPLELYSIKLYSTGVKGKVYTNHFYRSMNHNFGVEIQIRNNTSLMQNVKIGGCINDALGNTVVKWKTTTKQIPAHSSLANDFFVYENDFSKMRDGEYFVQFWINDMKVKSEYFTVSFK